MAGFFRESIMQNILKLDFNERSDQISLIAKNSAYPDLWRYPEREKLEIIIAAKESLSKEQVLCTNGGDEAIMILMRIIKESATLVLPLPAFSQYTWGVKSWNLNTKLIDPNSDLTINILATKQAILNSKQSVTIITRPNNPTGEKIAQSLLFDLIKTAADNNGWVFLDEAYIEFADDNLIATDLIKQFDNLVILRTLSKAYGLAGIRLGYLLGNEKLIEQFKIRCMPFNIAQPSLNLAEQALSKDNQQEVFNYCQIIKQNRLTLINWLQANDIEVLNSEANFVLLRVDQNRARAIKSFLSKNSILVRDFQESILSGCIRITVPYSLQKLLPLLQQVLTPQLICFDMDGVLIDTSESYDLAIKATVESISGKTVSLEEIFALRDSGGFNNDWVLSQALLSQLNQEVALDKVTDVFQSIYLGENNNGLVANEKKLINQSFVTLINDSSNYQFSIVTGRPRIEAQTGAKLVNLSNLPIISLDDVAQAKPSPEGIKQLQKQFSSSSWMCGDNPDDMQAAKGSNSVAIGIGTRNAKALYQSGADIVLESINQLEGWLKPVKPND